MTTRLTFRRSVRSSEKVGICVTYWLFSDYSDEEASLYYHKQNCRSNCDQIPLTVGGWTWFCGFTDVTVLLSWSQDFLESTLHWLIRKADCSKNIFAKLEITNYRITIVLLEYLLMVKDSSFFQTVLMFHGFHHWRIKFHLMSVYKRSDQENVNLLQA